MSDFDRFMIRYPWAVYPLALIVAGGAYALLWFTLALGTLLGY
jgi:hypothetical protein